MIGQIFGIVSFIGQDHIVVQTSSGVGYVVFMPVHVMHKFHPNSEINLFVETIVREDAINLYGFVEYVELLWFKSLMKVSGVGAKVGLNVIGQIPIPDIIFAIENERDDVLKTVSGLGDKIAKRIISDLKKEPAKIAKLLMYSNIPNVEIRISDKKDTGSNSITRDAVSALEKLGFHISKINPIISTILQESKDITVEELISQFLKKVI